MLSLPETANDQEVEAAREEIRQKLVKSIVERKAILAQGKVASKTIFEPRILRFAPPDPNVTLSLVQLCKAVDHAALSTLALDSIFRRDVVDEERKGKLAPMHEKAVHLLRKTAHFLEIGGQKDGPIREKDTSCTSPTKHDTAENDETDKTVGGHYDVVHLLRATEEVVDAADEWLKRTAPPNRSGLRAFFDKDARQALKNLFLPWFMSSFSIHIFIGASVCELVKPERSKLKTKPQNHVFSQTTKFYWCCKFAIGFTSLVCMSVYWPAFADFFIPVKNEGKPVSPHFSGWYLIAYSMSTTTTTEGTVRKGTLRLLGSVLGGFSGWLAVTICGDNNAVGLVAWSTIVSVMATYMGLGEGVKARLGVQADYGYSVAVFVMTNSLVVFDVMLGVGGKNDITVNRVVSNAVGISFAILLAVLPPGWYGGSPKLAQSVLASQKEVLANALTFLFTHQNDDEAIQQIAQEIEDMRTSLRSCGQEKLAKAKAYYDDGNKLQKIPKVCWVDPKLGNTLNAIESLGSWIYVVIGFIKHIIQNAEVRESLEKDKATQNRIQHIIQSLQASAKSSTSLQWAEGATTESCAKENNDVMTDKPEVCDDLDLFRWYCEIALHKLEQRDMELIAIKHGLYQ